MGKIFAVFIMLTIAVTALGERLSDFPDCRGEYLINEYADPGIREDLFIQQERNHLLLEQNRILREYTDEMLHRELEEILNLNYWRGTWEHESRR